MRPDRRLSIEEFLPYCIPDTPEGEVAPPIDWRQLFGNDHPVEIEVGFGKGHFLLSASAQHPEVNYLGIEVIRKLQQYVATRLSLRERSNVRVAHANAKRLLHERVPDRSVQAMHIYFPDPWWKRRHRRRRVFTSEFVMSTARVLQPGGRFHIVTDVEEYFEVMLKLVRPLPQFRETEPPPLSKAEDDMDYLTNFERKFRKLGLPTYRTTFERVEDHAEAPQ